MCMHVNRISVWGKGDMKRNQLDWGRVASPSARAKRLRVTTRRPKIRFGSGKGTGCLLVCGVLMVLLYFGTYRGLW